MANKAFNVNLVEPINTIQVTPRDGADGVDRQTNLQYEIIVSRNDYAISNLSSGSVLAAVIDESAGDIDIPDLSNFLSVKNASPTGTATVASGTTALAVSGGALSSEAAVGDFVYFTDALYEYVRIDSIAGNEDAVLSEAASQSLSSAWEIHDSVFGVVGGKVDAFTFEISKIEASSQAQAIPDTWTEVEFSDDGLQIQKLNSAIAQHAKITIDVSIVGISNVTELDELGSYFAYLYGEMPAIQLEWVDEVTA